MNKVLRVGFRLPDLSDRIESNRRSRIYTREYRDSILLGTKRKISLSLFAVSPVLETAAAIDKDESVEYYDDDIDDNIEPQSSQVGLNFNCSVNDSLDMSSEFERTHYVVHL